MGIFSDIRKIHWEIDKPKVPATVLGVGLRMTNDAVISVIIILFSTLFEHFEQ